MMSEKIQSLDGYRKKLKQTETRVKWGTFPAVFIFNPLGTAKNHPDYDKAKKEGNELSALQLVKAIVSDERLNEFKALIDVNQPYVVPVHAIEAFGTNRIPAAFAYYLAKQLGYHYYDDIV